MNSISIITPYRYANQWVFDDPEKGLVREALIAGIDKMIDHMTKDIPNASLGFNLLFSPTPFPGCTLELEFSRSEMGGSWYYSRYLGIAGWLCPALFKYFDKAPKELYAEFRPRQ